MTEDKKLAVETIEDLLQCGINTVEPYALMLAPVYVFMKLNDKLVSVKAPLDFFTPEELNHLSRYEVFYIPKSVQQGSRFQTSAKLLRNLLKAERSEEKLSPAVYEVSNEVLLAMASLWGSELRVEPFYSAVFADELCGSLPPDNILVARETAVVRHEMGILLTGVLTFVLLQLGWLDLDRLTQIRLDVYQAIVESDEDWEMPKQDWQIIARDLKKMVSENSALTPEYLKGVPAEWSKKLLGRLERIRQLPNLKNYPSIKVSEEKGHVA